jgi:acyl-CoA thioesterase-1
MRARVVEKHSRTGALALALAVCLGVAASASPSDVVRTSDKQAAPVIMILGDSISAEYGLPRDSGWVALLRRRLGAKRLDYNVANASISGDTTSGGRARLPALLAHWRPAIVVVELGGNDALRGQPLATTESNLRAIIEASRQAGARVLLIGMQVPPNYGQDYTQQFQALYTALARDYHAPLVPFLFAGIATHPELFQSDGIHPTRDAQPALLDNVWPRLLPLLRESDTASAHSPQRAARQPAPRS